MAKKTGKFKRDWSNVNKKILDRKKKFKDDERIYKVKYDTSTNSSKVIMRFLPPIDEEAMPYAEQHRHFFQDTDGWYVENCPTTLGNACPVCDDLRKTDMYNVDNALYMDRKKQVAFYTNVLIIEDKVTPSNEGKVFLYKFGNKIMEKIEDSIDDGLEAWNPENGVNFTLSAKKKKNSNMGQYDASRFSDSQSSIEDYGDFDGIMSMRHDLSEFEDEDSYKEYDVLKARYLKVTGQDGDANEPAQAKRRTRVADNDVDNTEPEPTPKAEANDVGDSTMFDESDDDDDFFDDLIDDDE